MNVRILLATLATIILAACGGTPDATLIIDQTPDAPTMTAPEPDAGGPEVAPLPTETPDAGHPKVTDSGHDAGQTPVADAAPPPPPVVLECVYNGGGCMCAPTDAGAASLTGLCSDYQTECGALSGCPLFYGLRAPTCANLTGGNAGQCACSYADIPGDGGYPGPNGTGRLTGCGT